MPSIFVILFWICFIFSACACVLRMRLQCFTPPASGPTIFQRIIAFVKHDFLHHCPFVVAQGVNYSFSFRLFFVFVFVFVFNLIIILRLCAAWLSSSTATILLSTGRRSQAITPYGRHGCPLFSAVRHGWNGSTRSLEHNTEITHFPFFTPLTLA